MYYKLISNGVNFICEYGNGNEENREIYSYGLDIMIMYFMHCGALLILGIIFNRVFETLLLLFGFALLQCFGGGYHAMTHLRCFLLMLAGWAVSMLLIPVVEEFFALSYMLMLFGIFTIFLLSPIKHVNFPMSKEKEIKMRITARLIAESLCIISLACSLFPASSRITAVLNIILFMSGMSMISANIKQFLTIQKD